MNDFPLSRRLADLRRRRAVATAIFFQSMQLTISRTATLAVTNLADTGPATLRESLASAQRGDVIIFAVAGTISNGVSELVISDNVSNIDPRAGVIDDGRKNESGRLYT